MNQIAGVFVQRDGKVLMVQERKEEAYMLWNLPAGKVENGESLEDAAKREGEEETGLKLRITDKIKVFSYPQAELHIFRAEVISGEINFNKEELLEVKWIDISQVKNLKLRQNYILELI